MQNKEEKKTYSILLPVIVVLALVLGYYALASHHKNVQNKAVDSAAELTLNVMPLKTQDVKIEKSYIGYVTPINDVNVLPYISGFLEDIFVEGGQEVKQGDTLIIIRQNEYKARMDAAKAEVMQAEATFNNAKVYYKRIQDAGPKAISKTEVDNAKASFLSAQAQVANAKANYELAKVNYEYTIIQAPISGIVGNVTLTKGDYVSPASTPLLRIIQFDPIRVVFSITDKDYLEEITHGSLFEGEKIKLKLADGRIFEKSGTYKFADNELNKTTNSISVFADFENADKTLVSNAYVDVLVEKNYSDGVLINQNLVTMSPEGNYVYLVNNNRLDKVKIEIITSVNNQYLVKNGFKKGDYIVLDKIGRIGKNQKIKINVVPATDKGEKK